MTFAEDYNPVSERIEEFRAKHPDGTLQSTILFTPGDIPGWVVEARAYRTPDDERPGYGLAFEPVPGKTNFTRDSELQNCETSAWGRALIAVGAADAKKGIASAEDIENRPSPAAASAQATKTTDPGSRASSKDLERPRDVAGDSGDSPEPGSQATSVVAAGGTSEAVGAGKTPAASDDRVEGVEASESGDSQDGDTSAPSHVHHWVDSPKLSKYAVCDVEGCLATERKSKVMAS